MSQKGNQRPMTTEYLRRYADHFTVTRHALALIKESVARGEDVKMDQILQRVAEDLAREHPEIRTDIK